MSRLEKEVRKDLANGVLDVDAHQKHIDSLTYLSPTRINTYQNCPTLYYLTYVMGLRR